ncbi:hypothetical protein DASB73_036120 [Starmerella bacillaris]|uniref:VanZ-like domain-containing protein n=1 Tax=Starmerella bacillaris TaxID=1247836 RepID=A0AAV5RMA4_STABA|nr:hypothetical protein DASB73_036120 [Starmerella bacillaris]
MRIRVPIAVAFVISCFGSTWLGLKSQAPIGGSLDKFVHFVVFFLMTILFYWMLDLPRKKLLKLTLAVCVIGASILSEIIQKVLGASDRQFDMNDIFANILGSLAASGLSYWYHGRQLERRRQARYDRLQSEVAAGTEETEAELELNTVAPEPAA